MEPTVTIFGHTACGQCLKPVLNEIAYKTRGLCADCFREQAGSIINPVMVVVDGREKIVLRNVSHRTPAERSQRARARKRKRQQPDEKQRRKDVAACAERARRRLQRLFPELWEVLLADERAKAGLAAWTIDRALTPGEASSSLEMLAQYHHVEVPHDQHDRNPAA
jgi:hypothetical protein